MKKNEELFALIKSMSQSEKRHFRLQTRSCNTESNYLMLFDAIDSQTVYDEGQIRKQFQGKRFIRQLHVTKNYLKGLILKSLRNVSSTSKSPQQEVRNLLSNIEILYGRMLYKHCQSELRRAEYLCKVFEMDTALIEVLNWKRKLVQANQPGNTEDVAKILIEEDVIIKRLENTFQHRQLMVQISQYGFDSGVDNPIQSELLESEEKAISFQAKVQYFHSIYHINIVSGNEELAEKALYDLMKFMESHPEQIDFDPGLYISSVNNFLAYFVFQRRFREALDLIKASRGIFDRISRGGIDPQVFRQILRTLNIELEIYRDSLLQMVERDVVAVVEDLLEKPGYSIPREYLSLFYFQLASIYFKKGDYSRALKWINEHLNSDVKDVRTDLQIYVRILNLIIHLELQNLFVLGYFIDSTRRYLKKVRGYEEWMKVLLRFFSRMRNIPSGRVKDEFRKLHAELFPEGTVPMVSGATLDYVDLKGWIMKNQ